MTDLERAIAEETRGYWHDCWECGGEGYSGHDCGEDTCCCLYPDDDVICPTCGGAGGWYSSELPE